MPTSISNQAHIFLWAVAGGMAIGFVYDLFRIKRKAVKTGALFTYLEDFLYWVIVALIMLSVVYLSNDGEIRGYIFLGTVIGVILYTLLLSRIVIKLSIGAIKLLWRVLSTIWKIVIYPIKIILKILAVPGRFLSKKARAAFRKVKRSGKLTLSKAAIWRRIFRNARKKI